MTEKALTQKGLVDEGRVVAFGDILTECLPTIRRTGIGLHNLPFVIPSTNPADGAALTFATNYRMAWLRLEPVDPQQVTGPARVVGAKEEDGDSFLAIVLGNT